MSLEVVGKHKARKAKKEKLLTVKPIRVQLEEPRHTLSETLNVSIETSELKPLDLQIAGHGSCGDGHRGLLVHKSGLVLKPVQPAPKGPREVSFYQGLVNPLNDVDMKLKCLIPMFYGVETLPSGDQEYIMLENLTVGCIKPCVLDVKIGAITYGPDASEEKILKETSKYIGTKGPLGFSLLGMIIHNENGSRKLDKSYGKNLAADNVDQILDNFINTENFYLRESYCHI